MIRVEMDSKAAEELVFKVSDVVENRTELHQVLGDRLTDELKDWFFARNDEPNKRGWKKQEWWAQVAKDTALTSADESGATVTVANREGFYLRVHGGTIRPREKKALTIPLEEAAYGKSVDEYEAATGRKLFRPRGARYLAYSDGDDSITPVYFLAKQVTISKDPNALPPVEDLAAALTEEANDFIKFNLQQA